MITSAWSKACLMDIEELKKASARHYLNQIKERRIKLAQKRKKDIERKIEEDKKHAYDLLIPIAAASSASAYSPAATVVNVERDNNCNQDEKKEMSKKRKRN